MALNLIVILNSITDISFLKYVTKIFCISYYFQEKFWGSFKVQLSVTASEYILSSKGANQLQVLYIRTLGKIQKKLIAWNSLLLKLQSSNVFPAMDFWKYAEVLGQQKNFFWKIMSYHIIQLIKRTRDFVNCLPYIFLCVLCLT